jgi:hypothetical protein
VRNRRAQQELSSNSISHGIESLNRSSDETHCVYGRLETRVLSVTWLTMEKERLNNMTYAAPLSPS